MTSPNHVKTYMVTSASLDKTLFHFNLFGASKGIISSIMHDKQKTMPLSFNIKSISKFILSRHSRKRLKLLALGRCLLNTGA